MKKYFFIVLFFVFLIMINLWIAKKNPSEKTAELLLTPLMRIAQKAPSDSIITGRTPASTVAAKTHYVPHVEHSFSPDPNVTLDRGQILTLDIGAIPKNLYKPEMGELISEDKQYKYYKKSPTRDSPEGVHPVAYNPSKNRFRPISSVVHLKNVNEGQRQEILSAGFEEYYFDQKLKILFIQTSATEVLDVYQVFKDKGLSVHLEILALPLKAH